MKIAIVIERFFPGAGGNERSTAEIARRLAERGHAVTILTSAAPPRDDLPPGVSVAIKGGLTTRTAAGLLAFVRWTGRRLDSPEFDASISMTSAVAATVMQPRGGTVREAIERNIARKPTALKQNLKRLTAELSPKQRALLLCERLAFHHARTKRIAALSRYVADQLFHHYTIRSKMIELIPNAAEPPRMTEAERVRRRRRVRQILRIGEGDVAFVFAAMNPSLKGLGELRRAFAKLRVDEPRARLVIAGSTRRATDPAVEGETWIGPTRQVASLYCAADVTVLPTWYDPSSKVVLESLLHRVPAVTTLYNGACQFVLDPTGLTQPPSPLQAVSVESLRGRRQRAGRVVHSPSDVDALAGAMRELIDDTERRACAMACIGIEPLLSMDTHVEKLEALLKEAAGAVIR